MFLCEIALLTCADQRTARLTGDQRLHVNNVLVLDLPAQLHLFQSQESTAEDSQ